jgi:hypothetical protein
MVYSESRIVSSGGGGDETQMLSASGLRICMASRISARQESIQQSFAARKGLDEMSGVFLRQCLELP